MNILASYHSISRDVLVNVNIFFDFSRLTECFCSLNIKLLKSEAIQLNYLCLNCSYFLFNLYKSLIF